MILFSFIHATMGLPLKEQAVKYDRSYKITILRGLEWSHDNRYHPKSSSPTLIILSPHPSPIQQKCFLCCVWQLSRRTTEPEYWLPSFVGSSSVGSCGLHHDCCSVSQAAPALPLVPTFQPLAPAKTSWRQKLTVFLLGLSACWLESS